MLLVLLFKLPDYIPYEAERKYASGTGKLKKAAVLEWAAGKYILF